MTSMVDAPTPEPRILIAEGPWSMKEPIAEPAYDIVVHKCKWKDNWLFKTHDVPSFIMLGDDPYCMNCNEKVPNMFKTLWTLKNLDKIQDSAQYSKFVWMPSSFYMMNSFYIPTSPKP